MFPGGPYELKIEGSGKVRRFFSALTSDDEDTPAIRRIAPRNVSLIFIRFFLLVEMQCGDSRPRLSIERSSTYCGAGALARKISNPPRKGPPYPCPCVFAGTE